MEINRLCQLRARAYENMLAVATCNYPENVPDCNGRSTVFDGVALEQLREYRKNEVHGNTYRHPLKYGILTKTGVEEPFIREDCRR